MEIWFFCLASSPLIHLREAPHSVAADTEFIPFLVAADGERPDCLQCKQILEGALWILAIGKIAMTYVRSPMWPPFGISSGHCFYLWKLTVSVWRTMKMTTFEISTPSPRPILSTARQKTSTLKRSEIYINLKQRQQHSSSVRDMWRNTRTSHFLATNLCHYVPGYH